MIKQVIFGDPIDTGAIVKDIEREERLSEWQTEQLGDSIVSAARWNKKT